MEMTQAWADISDASTHSENSEVAKKHHSDQYPASSTTWSRK